MEVNDGEIINLGLWLGWGRPLKGGSRGRGPGRKTIRNMKEPEYKEFKNKFNYINWSESGSLLHIAHATGLCSGVYSKFSEKFAKQYKVIGLDFRGHGKTKAPADPASLNNWEVFISDLEFFFSHFNQPLVAIGHSMGGTISALLAARYPGLISKLILIEPGLMPPMWRPFVYLAQKTGLSMHVPFVTRVTKRKSSWKTKDEAIAEFLNKGPFKSWRNEVLEAYVSEGMEILESGSAKLRCSPIWEGRILETAPCGIWREVSRITSPTLVLYGGKSKTFVPSVAAKIKKLIPHAIIKEMPNAGHFIPMEHPEESAEIVLGFIENA